MIEDNDPQLDVGMESLEELRETDRPVEMALSAATDVPTEALSLASGGILLLSAAQSLVRGQLRAIPKAIAGAGLLRYGLRKRRSSARSTFEPNTDEIEGGSAGKEISDAAHAAGERPDSGRESQIDAGGDIDDSSQLGEEGDAGSRIEFTDDAEASEPRSKPGLETDDDDPRRNTDGDSVEIDVSEPAMAEEASEATGPDPEQAQPSQTDAIEPEETPDEDASHMKVEPDDEDDEAEDHDAEASDEDSDDET